MLSIVWKEQKIKKNMLIWLGLFLFILSLYFFFDVLANESLNTMFIALGPAMFTLHIAMNIILALITSSMLSLTQINLSLNKREPVGSNSIPVLSFIFGLLTFGCTPCVIAFLAAFGIAFTPLILGPGNIIWKIILLGLILIAYLYILNSINKATCKPKISTETQS